MAKAIPIVAAAAGVALSLSGVGTFAGIGLLNAGLGLSAGTGIFLGSAISSLAGFVVSTAISSIGTKALSKKSKASSPTASASGQSVMVRSTIESHKIIYGTSRVSGPIVFIGTADTGNNGAGESVTGTNKFLHIVIALAGHEVDAIQDIYFNDQIVTLDAGGWVTSTPYAIVTTSTTQNSAATISIDHGVKSTEVVTVTTSYPHGFSLGDKVTISTQAVTNKATGARSFPYNGTFILKSVPSPTTFTYEQLGSNATYTGGSAKNNTIASSTSTNTASYARVKKFLGSDDQEASPELMAEVMNWGAGHRLRGIAYIHVRLEYNPDAFPQGIPNVSAVVRGKRLFDPRTGTTAFSANPALCIRDYMTSDYGFDCDDDEINDTYFINAANICDESVTLTTGGSQLRYTCNGVIDTATAPLQNLNALVSSLAGAVTYVQGMFRCHAGAFDEPEMDITLDMLAGPVKVRTRPGRQDLFNAVRGTYVDPGLNWQPTDFPAVTNATYEAEDGGKRIFRDIDLALINHPEAAQRVGKVILEQGRQGIQVEITLNHRALSCAVYDTVTLTNPELGWDQKVFRIKKLSTPGIGPITLALQEESAASYDWNSGEATVTDPSPDTNLPDPFSVSSPGALTVTESKYVTRDGTAVKALASLSWVPSDDAFLSQYQPEYKLTDADAWVVLPRTTATAAEILDITPGDYLFRVKAVNIMGASSPYSTAPKQISGLQDAPTEPQNLTISTIGGFAMMRWDQSQDIDVRIGGKIVFRHSPSTGANWNQTTTIGNAVPGSSNSVVLPLKPGAYLAKAVDSSGIESADYALVTTEQATALAYANVTTLTEHPGFSGAKTDVIVDGTTLKLTGTGQFDSIPDFDAVPSLDSFGGADVAGIYYFSGAMDLGSVSRVRLTGTVEAEVIQIFDLIDSRISNIDDWLSFDGTNAAEGDAILYVRGTPDDPAGSPTWGEWQRLDSGEFHARAFEFKLEMSVTDETYNIIISQLEVNADEVV